MSEITPNSYGLFDTPVRSPEKKRVTFTQADIERQLDKGAFLMKREEAVAASERSDVCAIFALEIIAEAAVAEVLAEAVAERLGGDTMAEVADRYARLP